MRKKILFSLMLFLLGSIGIANADYYYCDGSKLYKFDGSQSEYESYVNDGQTPPEDEVHFIKDYGVNLTDNKTAFMASTLGNVYCQTAATDKNAAILSAQMKDEGVNVLKGYSDSDALDKTVKETQDVIRQNLYQVADVWDTFYKGSQIFDSKDVIEPLISNLKTLNPNLVTTFQDGPKSMNVVTLNDAIPETAALKKILVDPFMTGDTYNKKYVQTGDNDLKVYSRPNLNLVMGVIEKDNVKGQEYMLQKYCDKILCVYNDNGDMLVYPNLPPNTIKTFNLFLCSYDGNNLVCNKNEVAPGTVDPKDVDDDNLPNDLPTPVDPTNFSGAKVPSLPQIGETPTTGDDTDSCGNGKVDPWEECDPTAPGWSTTTCEAPGLPDECKVIKSVGNSTCVGSDCNTTPDVNVVKTPDPQKPFYCGLTKGGTFTSGDVTYTIESVTPITTGAITTEVKGEPYDLVTYLGYIKYVARDSDGNEVVFQKPLKYTFKEYYYLYGDFNNDGKFDGETIDKYANLDDASDIATYKSLSSFAKTAKFLPDPNKLTAEYNMYDTLKKYFVISDTDINDKTSLDVEKYALISDYSSSFQDLDGNEVCVGSGIMNTVNLYKKYNLLMTQNQFLTGDVSIPNLVYADELVVDSVIGSKYSLSFPSLQDVTRGLKIENTNLDALHLPLLTRIGDKIGKLIDFENLDDSTKSLMDTRKWEAGLIINKANINTLDTQDLKIVYKSIYVAYSNIENWLKSNLTTIQPMITHYVEDLDELGLNQISRETVYLWEGALQLVDDGSRDMPYEWNNLKNVGAIVLMGPDNKNLYFNNLDWVYDGIFLRNANGNQFYFPKLSKLGVLFANGKTTYTTTNECSDAYVKQFRAANFSSWDLEDSSNNVFHHGDLRYLAFARDKISGPFLDYVRKYIYPQATKIGIAPAYDPSSNGNKVDWIVNDVCGGKDWDGQIGDLGLYFYNDSEDWTSPGYDTHYDGMGLLPKINELQSYMYVKGNPGYFQRDADKNKPHLEFALNIPTSTSPTVVRNIIAKIPGVNVPPPPPWLGDITQDGKEGSVIITLGETTSTSNTIPYTAYTPQGTYGGGLCSSFTTPTYYCKDGEIYETDKHYDCDTDTRTVVYDGPYKTRSFSLPQCKSTTSECINDGYDELVKYYAVDTNAYLGEQVIKNGCVVTSFSCDGDDGIIKYYKNKTKTDDNLFNTVIRPKDPSCYTPDAPPPVVTPPAPPPTTVDILTYLGSTDLVFNDATPAIHTNDGTVYGLSNYLWLSKIDTHTKEATSAFAIKGIMYFKDDDGDGKLSLGDDIYVVDNSGDDVTIGEYTGADTSQGVGIYVPTTGDADENYLYFPVKYAALSDGGSTGDVWIYGPIYLMTCEDSVDTVCHYNDNDYQYFEVDGKEYVIGRYTHPGQTIKITDSDGNEIDIPVKDAYHLFVKDDTTEFWQDLGPILDVPSGSTIRLDATTVNDNGTVNLYYTQDGENKALVISGL